MKKQCGFTLVELLVAILITTVVLAAALGVGAVSMPDRPDPVTLPEHTTIHVTLDQSVTSRQNRSGDHFDATVSEPVVSGR